MHILRVASLTFALTAAFALVPIPARAADDAGAKAEKLVPLKYETPKAMFLGTPKNIKASATLEPYSEKAKEPLRVPEGFANLAAKKKVTFQRLQSNHRRVVADHRRRQGRRRRQLRRIGPRQAVGADRPGKAGRHFRGRHLALSCRGPRLSWRRRADFRRSRIQQGREDRLQQRLRQRARASARARTWSTSTIIAARRLP